MLWYLQIILFYTEGFRLNKLQVFYKNAAPKHSGIVRAVCFPSFEREKYNYGFLSKSVILDASSEKFVICLPRRSYTWVRGAL